MKYIFESIRESDIDMLIIEEFTSSPDFAAIFLDAVGFIGEYTIDKAYHSKRDAEFGESDIVFILNQNGKKYALHIEDKIDAIAMQKQDERYILRAEKEKKNGEYDNYGVLICAPEKYLQGNDVAKKYTHQVQYEQLQQYFKTKNNSFKLAVMNRALEEAKNGYQWEESPDVSRYCKAFYAYQKEKFPQLPKGTVAWWPHYKTIKKGVQLVFKANKGAVDLQFSQLSAADLYNYSKDYLTDEMKVIATGKSSVIRIEVQPIYFTKDFYDYIDRANEALVAITKLWELSNELLSKE